MESIMSTIRMDSAFFLLRDKSRKERCYAGIPEPRFEAVLLRK